MDTSPFSTFTGWNRIPINDCLNCLDHDSFELIPSESPTFWEVLQEFCQIFLVPVLIYLGIVMTISFLITLGFFFIYKHKKDEHPWKHAIKRSWLWWIVIFLIPFILQGLYLII